MPSLPNLFFLLRSLGLVVVLWSGLAVPSAFGQVEHQAFRLIEQMEFVADDSTTPPPGPDADWQALQLPLGTREGNRSLSNRVVWMRFTLERPASEQMHSLYFFRYNLSVDVFFNGVPIGGNTYRPGRQTVGWNHPLLVDIQNANWQPGSNTVMIRFVASYYGGTFAPVVFGPTEQLQPLYEERLFRQVKINEWLQALGIVTTVLACVLWCVRRQDATYLLFAGMTACWSMLTTHMVLYYNLLAYRYWLPILHSALDLFVLLMYCFLVRHINLPSPRGEKAVKLWAVTALGWHLLAPLQFWWMGAYVFHLIGNGFIFYLLARIVAKALYQKDSFAIAISLTLLVQMGLFGHDLFMVLFATPADWESAMYYSQFAFPLLLVVFAATLLHRFVSALNLSESLNRELEAKVEASRQIIEQSYATRRKLELEQAAEQERLAIYRDLHDDVGSKLLSIVHAGRDSRLGELARGALESLRNAVSRANSPDQLLSEFLQELREEAELRLQGSGHRVDWEQPDHIPEHVLASSQVFNLNQISRELVSNIIRHAQASVASICIRVDANNLLMRFSDNGRGLNSESLNGNGLLHIQQRVQELHGEYTLSGKNGLVVQLSIPLHATRKAMQETPDPAA